MFPVPSSFGMTCLLNHSLLVLGGINHTWKNFKEERDKCINMIEAYYVPRPGDTKMRKALPFPMWDHSLVRKTCGKQ